MKIGAVVVLYNPTIDEIKNINSYKKKVDYVVVVDNSSISNKNEIKKYIDSSIIYYSEKKNLGLCKGFNIGINILKEKGCQWALLFDADSKLENDITKIYKEAIKKTDIKKVALFSPVHIYDRNNKKSYNGYKEISWTMTSGCLFNIDVFIEQQGFFEELFVDGLDMDYCFKSRKNGYKIIECGEAVLNHNPAETKKIFGIIKFGYAPPFRYYMQARQLIWVTFKYKKFNIFLIYLYKWFKVIFLFPKKIEFIKAMIKGTQDGKKLLKKYMD